jgi:hypothetical protein
MVEVRQTEEFSGWLHRLRDADAVARIVGRMRRMEMGNSFGTPGGEWTAVKAASGRLTGGGGNTFSERSAGSDEFVALPLEARRRLPNHSATANE